MFCKTCQKRSTCKILCKPIKDYLKSQGIYSSQWIRPQVSLYARRDNFGKWREKSFSAMGDNFQLKIGNTLDK